MDECMVIDLIMEAFDNNTECSCVRVNGKIACANRIALVDKIDISFDDDDDFDSKTIRDTKEHLASQGIEIQHIDIHF